jgi:hypothetical protein
MWRSAHFYKNRVQANLSFESRKHSVFCQFWKMLKIQNIFILAIQECKPFYFTSFYSLSIDQANILFWMNCWYFRFVIISANLYNCNCRTVTKQRIHHHYLFILIFLGYVSFIFPWQTKVFKLLWWKYPQFALGRVSHVETKRKTNFERVACQSQ